VIWETKSKSTQTGTPGTASHPVKLSGGPGRGKKKSEKRYGRKLESGGGGVGFENANSRKGHSPGNKIPRSLGHGRTSGYGKKYNEGETQVRSRVKRVKALTGPA